MKRRVKRVICSLLVAVIVIGIVLPIFPEGVLKAEAACFYDPVNPNSGKTMYTWTSKLKDFKLYKNDGTYLTEYEFNNDQYQQYRDSSHFDNDSDDILFKPDVMKVMNGIPLQYKDKAIKTFDFNKFINNMNSSNVSYNRCKNEYQYDSFSVAWSKIPEDTVLVRGQSDVLERDAGFWDASKTDKMYTVFTAAVGYSTKTNLYYYFIGILVDNQIATDWDSITISLICSEHLMGLKYKFYEEQFMTQDTKVTQDLDFGYKYADLSREVDMNPDEVEVLVNDIKQGQFHDLATYNFIDSISSVVSPNNYEFGTQHSIIIDLDYEDGNKSDETGSRYKGFRSTIYWADEKIRFNDMSEEYNFVITDAFTDQGDSGNLFKISENCNEDQEKIALQIAKIIEAITAIEMDNGEWLENAKDYAQAIKDAHPDSILVMIPEFMEEMDKRRKTWILDGAGKDMNLKDLSDITNLYQHPKDDFYIMSAVIDYNFTQTSKGITISEGSEFTIENGQKTVRMTFSDKKKGSCDYTLNDIYSTSTTIDNVQKLELAYSFNMLHKNRFKSSYGNDWKSISYENALNSLTYDASVAQELIKNEQVSIESIKGVVSKRDESITNTRSVYNVARNANSLGQYIVGVNLYNEASGSSSTGIYEIYDSTLHSMYHLNYEWSDINTDWFPMTLPTSLGILSEKSGDKYLLSALRADDDEDLGIFLQFIYNLTYAFEVAAFSEGAESNGYTVDDIKAALEGDEKSPAKAELTWISESNNLAAWKSVGSTNTAKDLQLQGQDFSIGMIRSIIELHDFCEFLGILDDSGHLKIKWTPAIEEYLNLYAEYEDIFEAFRQNEYIYSMAEKGETTVEEPLGKFFNIEKKQLTDNWIKGFAVSSQYVPMETNLYDATSINMIEDSDWVSDFYYKYAFYRKALYINVDNSAIVNEFVSTEKSTTRVATLSDLLNYERDIVLYIDDNFYNADDVNTVISKIDYTSVRQNTDATSTEDGNVITDLTNWAAGAFSLSPQQILKTGSETYYSNTIAQNCTKLNKTDTNNPNLLSKVIDAYLISNDEILGKNGKESVLNDYEYSVKQSYGVVSAVYKSETLYNETLKAIVADNALFKSSKAICYTPGTSSSDWRSLYNYYMLANLEEQMKNDASSTLDLNAPIFCDIFGNIVTESGLVIIPAACNATLCGKYWTPYTIGWAEYYNNGNHIKEGELNDDVYTWLLGFDYESYVNGGVDADGNVVVTSTERNKSNGGGHFEIDRNGELILRTTSINSGNLSAIIQWSTLSKNSTIIKQLFFNDAYFNKGMNMYNSRIVNLIVETLRGAPIEAIDYEYEGLDGNQDISKYGVYMAYKLEEITNSLISGTNGNAIGGNAVVTMPNLAFVDGIEYIVLYVFKIVFAIAVVGLAISLYMDAVINKLGVASVGKFVITVLMVIFAITLVPNIITWSYYKANKDILKEEVGYVMMLNYCKTYDGSEIGITQVTTPETSTELFLKIDDISVDWWSIIDDVLFKDTFATVDELYDSQLDGNLMSELPDVQKKGDGLYIDVQDIYDSTKLNYMPATGVLKNTVYGTGSKASSVDTVASFTLPYYVVLEQLIANVNEYNIARDIAAYSYSVGNNGNIYTYGVIGPYLTSDEFLSDGYDILGFDRILRTGTNRVCYNFAFDESDVQSMELSQWYPTEAYTIDMRKVAIENIYSYARQYVANNASLIGKVPDEVFLKVMAMQVAIECNKEFLAPYGKSIEIMNIDTRDLARFMVSDRASMYKYYSYGYARYVYEQAGGIGVIFAGFYIALLWITSFLKPLFMIIILGLLIINAIFRKVLFRKENKAIEGYLIGCMCLCITNYTYAFMLKVSLNIANTSLGSITALACAFIVQIAYIACLIGILRIEIKDWKNSGYGEFMNVGANIMAGVNHTKQLVVEKFMVKHNAAYGDTQQSRRAEYSIDEPTVDDMLDRDAEREMNAADNPV